LSFWTSFWARKNPYYECALWVIRLGKSVLNMIRPMSTRDSSLTFRMTCRGVFYSERAIPFFVILNELLGEEESLRLVYEFELSDEIRVGKLWYVQLARKILHCVQNDMPRRFSAIRTSNSFFFVILNELLGEEESLRVRNKNSFVAIVRS